MCRLNRPFRGHARSQRYGASHEACGDPVGAGAPANRPGQALENYQGIEQ